MTTVLQQCDEAGAEILTWPEYMQPSDHLTTASDGQLELAIKTMRNRLHVLEGEAARRKALP